MSMYEETAVGQDMYFFLWDIPVYLFLRTTWKYPTWL